MTKVRNLSIVPVLATGDQVLIQTATGPVVCPASLVKTWVETGALGEIDYSAWPAANSRQMALLPRDAGLTTDTTFVIYDPVAAKTVLKTICEIETTDYFVLYNAENREPRKIIATAAGVDAGCPEPCGCCQLCPSGLIVYMSSARRTVTSGVVAAYTPLTTDKLVGHGTDDGYIDRNTMLYLMDRRSGAPLGEYDMTADFATAGVNWSYCPPYPLGTSGAFVIHAWNTNSTRGAVLVYDSDFTLLFYGAHTSQYAVTSIMGLKQASLYVSPTSSGSWRVWYPARSGSTYGVTSWELNLGTNTATGPVFSSVGSSASKQGMFAFDGTNVINCGWDAIGPTGKLWLSKWNRDTGAIVSAIDLRSDPLFDNPSYTGGMPCGILPYLSYDGTAGKLFVFATPREQLYGEWRTYEMDGSYASIVAVTDISATVQGTSDGRLINPSLFTSDSCGPIIFSALVAGAASDTYLTRFTPSSNTVSFQVIDDVVRTNPDRLLHSMNCVDTDNCIVWFSTNGYNSGTMEALLIAPPD